MKATVGYLLFICMLAFATGCGSSQRGVSGKKAELVLGLWEVKAIHNSNESGYKETPPGMFKMVLPDGKFMNFISTDEGAIITVDGTYRLEGDLYTEEIVNSFNKSQEGKHNPLQIKLSQENFMYLRWFQPIDEFGVVQNRWIEEIWQRVRIEDLEVSNVDLQQELRSLLNNEEVIRQVVE
ncbi:MAG: DUF4488 domain-containing protein [Proteiniphilum sp.]|nr:DUF4488 domain-containing protein [Proteiniphilum sp.]